MGRREVRIANRFEEMAQVVALVDQFGIDNGIPQAAISDLNVALDEALNNVIAHGYGGGELGEITVRIATLPGTIVAEVLDAGRPFDPLNVPSPDLTLPLRKRKPGGVGIHFIRTLMDEVEYTRVAGQNVLRMTKKVSPA